MESNFSGDHLLSRTALVWCSVACVWKHFMKCCFLGNEGEGGGGKKRLWQLICRFFRAFCGGRFKTWFVEWRFLRFFPFFPCLLAWWVISFMLLVSSACSVGEPCRLWTIWVQWLNVGGGPYPSVAFLFFSGERQSTLKSPQTGTTGTILPESILMRKMSLFGLFTGCRQRVINRNKAEPQTALPWQSPIPSSMATSQKLHQRVLSQLTFYFLHTVALPMSTWSGRDD